MKYQNILVALSPESEKQYGLARAVRLVKEQKSDMPVNITVLLSIYDFSYEMSALLSAEERRDMHNIVIAQRQKEIQPYLEKYADPMINFRSLVVWNSNEAEAIVAETENQHYDLIVKYTKQEESLTSLFITPMDWQLLRKSSVPVLMVRDGDWKHQRRILVAVDVSGDEEYHEQFNQQLVSLSMSLADQLDRGNIHLVSAYPPTSTNMSVDLPQFHPKEEHLTSVRGQHLINMKTLRQHFSIAEDHTHVVEGFPEEVIPQVAEQLEAELVILGTVGRTGLSAALLGNTAEHVVNKLKCNLLTIKPNKD